MIKNARERILDIFAEFSGKSVDEIHDSQTLGELGLTALNVKHLLTQRIYKATNVAFELFFETDRVGDVLRRIEQQIPETVFP